jgi:hypothetical protein
MQHPEEGTIHAWLDDALSPSEAAAVDAHVRSCAACAAAVAEARGMIAGASRIVSALDSVSGGVIPRAARAAPPAGSLWRALHVTPARAALAATLLVAVASMLAVRHDTPDKLVPAPPVATSVAPSPAVVPALAPATAVPQPPARTNPSSKLIAPAVPPVAPPASAVPPATSVADNKATPASEPIRDSIQPKAIADERTQLRGVAGGVAREQGAFSAAPKAMRLQSLVSTSIEPRTQSYVGCYAVTKDSSGWPRSIPQRFALDSAAVAIRPGQHVVRAIGPTGRVDSVLTAATWHEIGPGFAMITFSLPEGTRVVTLDMSPHGTLSRMSCVP